MTVGHKSPIGLDGSLTSRLETQVEIVRSHDGSDLNVTIGDWSDGQPADSQAPAEVTLKVRSQRLLESRVCLAHRRPSMITERYDGGAARQGAPMLMG